MYILESDEVQYIPFWDVFPLVCIGMVCIPFWDVFLCLMSFEKSCLSRKEYVLRTELAMMTLFSLFKSQKGAKICLTLAKSMMLVTF